MKELVFLLEEASARALLESLLPRLLPDVTAKFISFEGKQDLKKQIARKIRSYQNTQASFIVMCDQDAQDCQALKQDLLNQCEAAGKPKQCLVRIACTELETFYLADLQAVEKALDIQGLSKQQATQKFRRPDCLRNPSEELKKMSKNRYQKVAGSRAIGKYLDLSNQRSPSFRNLVSAILRALNS